MPQQDPFAQYAVTAAKPDPFAAYVAQATPTEKPDPLARIRRTAGGLPAGELWQRVKDNPVQTGAMVGSMALTGGAGGPLLQMARAALGAAGGGGVGMAADMAQGGPSASASMGQNAATLAKEAALGAAGEGGGRVLGKGMELAGRGLYRAGLLPINQILGKYGDVVKTGVEEAIPVSKGGAEKIAGVRMARSAAKKDAITAADDRVSFRAGAIADDARGPLKAKADALDIAGEGNPSEVFDKRLAAFTDKNPDGTLTPSRLEGIKGTLDDRNGGAYLKMRKREPLTAKEDSRLALTHAASRAQESAVPGYRDMNKGIMDAVGLEKAIQRRTSGSGGNQGLENAMTMLGGVSAIPARLAMLPPVLSGLGIGAYQTGKAIGEPAAAALKAALIAALGGQDE
jgi:hypothetical protein